MLNTNQVEEAEQENKPAKVNKSFVRSDGHKLGDMVLKPYSYSREVAAQTMQLVIGYLNEGGKARYDRTKMYPGVKNDVAIIMWLCIAATEDEITGACGEGAPYVTKAVEWAGKEGLLDDNDEPFWKAYGLMIDILNEVDDSRTKAQKKISHSESQTQTTTPKASILPTTPTT
jgi:hypothetical protein